MFNLAYRCLGWQYTISKEWDVYLRLRFGFSYTTIVLGIMFAVLALFQETAKESGLDWRHWLTWTLFGLSFVGQAACDMLVLWIQGKLYKKEAGLDLSEALSQTHRRLSTHGGHIHLVSTARSVNVLINRSDTFQRSNKPPVGFLCLGAEAMIAILVASLNIDAVAVGLVDTRLSSCSF